MSRKRLTDGLLLTLLVGVAAFCALRPIWNSDIWWQIVVGDWILENWALPREDVWALGEQWHSFSWLYQAFVAGLHDAAGLGGVRLVSVLWVTATFALAYVLGRRAGQSPAVALLLAMALLVAYHPRIRVRPHIVNLTAFTALTYFAVYGVPRRAHALVAALGFFLWGGLHGGGAMLGAGAIVIALLALLAAARDDAYQPIRSSALLVALAGLAAWIATPGSLRTVLTIAGNQGDRISAVSEWISYPAYLLQAEGNFNMLLAQLLWPIAAVTFALSFKRLTTPRGRVRLALAGYFLAIAFLWFRLYFLTVLAIVLTVDWQAHLEAGRSLSLSRGRSVVALALSALLAFGAVKFTTVDQFGGWSVGVEARLETVDTRGFPVMPVELLAEAGVEGRVFAPAHWGGFVLYHGYPRLTVVTDGRNTESPELMLLIADIRRALTSGEGAGALPAMYAAVDADFVLMPHPAFAGLPMTEPWVQVAWTDQADLYARRGPRLEEWMAAFSQAVARRRGGEAQ